MSKEIKKFDHLIQNLERITARNTIFNKEPGEKAFLSLGQGNISEWLSTLLPNTRLIIEPKIIGSSIAIQYLNGKLKKAINKNSKDITKEIVSINSIPKIIPLKKRIELRGVVYENINSYVKAINNNLLDSHKAKDGNKGFKFCAFHIFNCNVNHYQALQELKELDFKIPQTEITKYISDVANYRQYWEEGLLFKKYPTNGIVIKVNSRKLQKYLGDNNVKVNWAYAIN